MVTIMIIVLVVWILFVAGILHAFWASAIRQEQRELHTFPVTNNMRPFSLTITAVDRGLLHTRVYAAVKGSRLGNGLYYVEHEGERRPVWMVRSSFSAKSASDSDAQTLRMVLFDGGKLKYGDHITNCRPKEKYKDIREMVDVEDIHYPIVLKSEWKTLLVSFWLLFCGFVLLGISVMAGISVAERVFMAVLCGFSFIFAGDLLLHWFGDSVTIKAEDRILFRRLFRTQELDAFEVDYTIAQLNSGKPQLRVDLPDHRTFLGFSRSSRADIYSAAAYFNQLTQRKLLRKRYQELTSRTYYLVQVWLKDDPDMHSLTVVTWADDDGGKAIPVYSSAAEAMEVMELEKVAQDARGRHEFSFGISEMDLQGVLDVTDGFTKAKAVLLMYKGEHGEQEYKALEKDDWEKIRAEGEK